MFSKDAQGVITITCFGCNAAIVVPAGKELKARLVRKGWLYLDPTEAYCKVCRANEVRKSGMGL